ncbi:8-oxo-dGTP pyrophosphatase MutT (NUDIX family) [Propionibacteriaceae bacterium ES.041]|nr:8-oxo-dGTP pyrophosphatase MutT (NUDIX family) [Propionibacteriaceae bacterium ES.041]
MSDQGPAGQEPQQPGEFTINVQVVDDGIGVLQWNAATDSDTLTRGVGLAADDALIGRGLRRVEVALPSTDAMARRAMHRAGFRREGVRRQALRLANGELDDVVLYARLVDDITTGPSGFSGVMNSVLPTKRVIGHVIFRDSAGRILLCDTHFKADWELPGGVVEPRESPRVGAIREVAEELSLVVDQLRLLVVDWMPPYLGWDDALEFIFDGGVLTPEQIASIVKQDSEIVAVHWVPVERLADHVSELSARRLQIALSLAPGEVALTENGTR